MHEDSEREINSEFSSNAFYNKSNQYGLSALLRKYYNITDKLGLFIQPSIGYNLSKEQQEEHREVTVFNEYPMTKIEFNYHTIKVGTGVGLYFFLSDRFSLETTFVNINLEHRFDDQYEFTNYNATEKREVNI